MKKLRTRKDIVIVRPDKGSGVVILDRDIYDRKILEIINDTTKFKKLEDNPTLTREGQLQRFLRKIKDKNLFDENTYKKIYPCGSKQYLKRLKFYYRKTCTLKALLIIKLKPF